MTKLLLCFFLMALVADPIETSIDPFNGLSYIDTAEDLLSDGIQSSAERRDIEYLLVLSAVVDPQLRDHAILGLASIERDADFMHELLDMQTINQSLLLPQVIRPTTMQVNDESKTIEGIFKVLGKIRKGQIIKTQEAEALMPWGYLFPFSVDLLTTTRNRRPVTPELIQATLKVELAVLGGPTVWSADFATTSGRPIALSINEDLASRFNVNTNHRIKRNGKWVAE